MNIPAENTKKIDIGGRTFILNKMDARTGSYMLFKLMKLLPPIIEHLDIDKITDENFSINNLKDLNLTEALEPIFDLPEKEFRYIQDNCLKCIKELLSGGPQPIVQNNGDWGVNNIADDMPLVMNLTIQSLIFNLQGFFAGMPFSSAMKNLNLSQPTT